MDRMAKTVLTCAVVSLLAGPALASNAVRISQAYGGGGASTGTPTYTRDYVELLNVSNATVDVSGWALFYSSATGTFNNTNTFPFPAGTTIKPCGYLMIALGSTGTTGSAFPVTPDLSSTVINMSATAGKIALVSSGSPNGGTCPTANSSVVVDFVAYGSTANCSEGSPAGGTTNQQGEVRNNAGVTDTDNNLSDFTVTTNPVPHNSASSSPTQCTAVPAQHTSWGSIKTIYYR